MRLFKPNVDKMVKSRDIDGLVSVLEDPDPGIANSAVQALGQIKDARAVDLIVERLLDRTPFQSEKHTPLEGQMFRYSQAFALCVDNRGASILSQLARSNDSIDVQHCCIHALGELGAVELLLDLLMKPVSQDALFTCVRVLGNLKSRDAIEPLCEVALNTAGSKAPKQPRTSPVEAIHKTFDESLVGFIAKTLREIGIANQVVETALLSVLDHYPDYEGEGNAAIIIDLDALSSKQPRRASIADEGGEYSRTPDPFEEAVKALGALGRTHARNRLLEEAKKCIKPDHTPKVIGNTMYTSPWATVDQKCERLVKEALSQIESRLAKYPDPPEGWDKSISKPLRPVQAETIEVPNVWGTDDGEPFVILRYPDIDEIFKSISPSDIHRTVEAYLGHPDPKVRIATLDQVIARRSGAYNQRIIDVLADEDGGVRMKAADALWTDFSAVEFALACLRDEVRGYNSFGTATASTMTVKQALEGVEILRRAAPTHDASERFEAIYDDLWNAEQRAEAERAAYRAKKSKIEDIKHKLTPAELDTLRASMTDVERQFDIGDVFLNRKIEEKYLNQQDEPPADAAAASKAEPQAALTPERTPAEHSIPESVTQTKPSEGEILCPYCETYIVPQAIGGNFYCPNDGRMLDLSVSTAALEKTPEQIVTVYCDDCGRMVMSGRNASIPEQCPYCHSRNLIRTNT